MALFLCFWKLVAQFGLHETFASVTAKPHEASHKVRLQSNGSRLSTDPRPSLAPPEGPPELARAPGRPVPTQTRELSVTASREDSGRARLPAPRRMPTHRALPAVRPRLTPASPQPRAPESCPSLRWQRRRSGTRGASFRGHFLCPAPRTAPPHSVADPRAAGTTSPQSHTTPMGWSSLHLGP